MKSSDGERAKHFRIWTYESFDLLIGHQLLGDIRRLADQTTQNSQQMMNAMKVNANYNLTID